MRRQMLWVAIGLALVGAGWLGGRASEEEAQARYHERRDAHVLADWTECTSLARDLSLLATA